VAFAVGNNYFTSHNGCGTYSFQQFAQAIRGAKHLILFESIKGYL
jgi:hypothetical protein